MYILFVDFSLHFFLFFWGGGIELKYLFQFTNVSYHCWLQLYPFLNAYTNMYCFLIQGVIIWWLLNWSPIIPLPQLAHPSDWALTTACLISLVTHQQMCLGGGGVHYITSHCDVTFHTNVVNVSRNSHKHCGNNIRKSNIIVNAFRWDSPGRFSSSFSVLLYFCHTLTDCMFWSCSYTL